MSDIELLFQQIKVSSCNCCTKAPEPKYHDMHCRFKLICELEKQSQLDLEQANKDKRELAIAINSINKNKQHEIFVNGDEEPCYWQRKEWIDWITELADKFLIEITAAERPQGRER